MTEFRSEDLRGSTFHELDLRDARFREAWDVVERVWAGTVERARTFAPEQLDESVEGEWSFIQTLRHLVYATDCWVNRVLLGDPLPFHRLDQPFDGAEPHPDVPLDLDARLYAERDLDLIERRSRA